MISPAQVIHFRSCPGVRNERTPLNFSPELTATHAVHLYSIAFHLNHSDITLQSLVSLVSGVFGRAFSSFVDAGRVSGLLSNSFFV